METLKQLGEVLQPDARNRHRYDIDHATRAITLTKVDSIYAIVEAITLNPAVPVEVKSRFDVARNVLLYSWFVYSFHEVAALQGLIALEMAAKIKTDESKTAFGNLLKKHFKDREFWPDLTLAEAVSYTRNDLAHGSTTRTGQGVAIVRLCAELINELYP